MVEVLIGRSGRDYIAIRVRRRKYPDATDYWDGNWVDAEVDVAIKPWHATYDATLRTEEFAEFRRQLESVYALERQDAAFSPMEPWISFALHLDALGHLDLTGEIGPEGFGRVFGQTRLVVHVPEFIDQTFLPPVIKQLIAIEREYPVIGQP